MVVELKTRTQIDYIETTTIINGLSILMRIMTSW